MLVPPLIQTRTVLIKLFPMLLSLLLDFILVLRNQLLLSLVSLITQLLNNLLDLPVPLPDQLLLHGPLRLNTLILRAFHHIGTPFFLL